MSAPLWRLSAVELSGLVRRGEVGAREVVESVLARIREANPHVNAIVELLEDEARAAAAAADRAVVDGAAPGVLHGVPVTTKVNVDLAGRATSDGVPARREHVAAEDSPPVANLRRAGAIVVGRTNTPAFSMRWFTDNDLYGRTLNPWDAGVTPGGSSGGAAAALALGMGAVAHGNDYGGSIRHPAWACGVVGLRPTVGRVPSFNASAREGRGVTFQLMSVQGPLTRSVADARLALEALAAGDPRDPLWTPAPLAGRVPDRPRAALLRRHPAYDADLSVVAALDAAAAALAGAGWEVEEAAPPHFEEAAELWRELADADLGRDREAMEAQGGEALRTSLRLATEGRAELDRDGVLQGLARRFGIAHDWSRFLQEHDVLLLPVSWRRPSPVDEDVRSRERAEALMAAQSPLLATAFIGLPGLAVPTGVADGLPAGVQLVAARFREDLCLRAGEAVERAAGFSALERLAA